MATSLNRVILAGKVSREPMMRQVSPTETVCCFALSVESSVTNLRGDAITDVLHVEVEAAGPMLTQYATTLHQGMDLFLVGRLRYIAWQDPQTGRRRNALVVRAEQLQADTGDHGAVPQEPASVQQQNASWNSQPAPAAPDQMDSPF